MHLSGAQGAMGSVSVAPPPGGSTTEPQHDDAGNQGGTSGSPASSEDTIGGEETNVATVHGALVDSVTPGAVRDVLSSNTLGEALWEEDGPGRGDALSNHDSVPGMVTGAT